MSKDLVTNDELAFLAKRNKEMAVEEFLTDRLKEKIQAVYAEALAQGILKSRLAQALEITKANLISLVTVPAMDVLAGMEEEEMMTFFYRAANEKGSHLMIVPMAELKDVSENSEVETLKEEFSDLLSHLYQNLSTMMGVEAEVLLDSVEVGILSTLETAKQFDLNQLTEVKQIQLVPASETFTLNLMHLSDVSFMEATYKGLAMAEVVEETPEVVAQPDKGVEIAVENNQVINEDVPTQEIYKPAFQPLNDVSPRESVSELSLLSGVSLDISAVLGKTKCSIQDLLELNVGAVVELDKLVDEPIEIYANDKQIAEGELVVIDENFGVKLTKLMK